MFPLMHCCMLVYPNSLMFSCLQIGLSASTIASSFGKAISENKDLEDYKPEDISLSLLRMISYNIGQVCMGAYVTSFWMYRIMIPVKKYCVNICILLAATYLTGQEQKV